MAKDSSSSTFDDRSSPVSLQGLEVFYTPSDKIGDRELEIEGEEFSHLTHVMRRSVGDVVVVVDGRGTAHLCTVRMVQRRTALCTIEARHRRLHEPVLDVTAAVGLLKHPARMDYLVEKLTEVGIGRIIPMHTSRSIPHQARIDRWQKIALAAMKQSGRCVLPSIAAPLSFAELLSTAADYAVKLIPHEDVREPHVRDVDIPREGRALVCIGPEGGFSAEEIRLAASAGFRPVSLGDRRLRTETAAVVAVAMMLR